MTEQNKVYVLLLNNEKYYIGKTINIVNRIIDHHYGIGSYYTKKHGLKDLVEIKMDCNLFEEENTVIEYMFKHGIDNVRGGIYCNETLTDNEINDIKKRIASVYNLCYNCGKAGHLTKKCPIKNSLTEKSIDSCLVKSEVSDKDKIIKEIATNDALEERSGPTKNSDISAKSKFGKKWTALEESKLIDGIKDGKKYNEIGSMLNRSYGAIKLRVIYMINRYYFKEHDSIDTICKKMYLDNAYVQTIVNNLKKSKLASSNINDL
jgi:predicted GIY-YIG superfamily endonuclease